MSLRLEMLQVARLAPKALGDSTELIANFVGCQQNPDGGFKDRAGASDLYYTVFGIDSLLAIQKEVSAEKIASYLCGIGNPEQLDFVHLCCLARCLAALDGLAANREKIPGPMERQALLARIERYRSADGGYSTILENASGTVYGGFLALGAYRDLGVELPDPYRLVQSFKVLETADGAWANERHVKAGSTNATAAAVTILRNLGMPINAAVGDWLMKQYHPQGGFVAAPAAPMPDLLSTATALHALAGLEHDIEPIRESCLDFVDSLWTNEGSFHGSWADETLDVEYTFYGLLALGHLSV